MNKLKLLFAFILFPIFLPLSAQDRLVSGTVYNSEGQVIVDGVIVTADPTHYTISDAKGYFELKYPSGGG